MDWIRANLLLVKIVACAVFIAGVFAFGWRQGAQNIQSAWDKEKAELNAQAVEKIQQANDKVRQLEAEAARKVASVEADYLQQLRRKDHEKADALRRASNGGLFINAKCSGSGNTLPPTTSSTAVGDGSSRVELPRADAEFLISFAAEADEVATQLSACQRILKDR